VNELSQTQQMLFIIAHVSYISLKVKTGEKKDAENNFSNLGTVFVPVQSS